MTAHGGVHERGNFHQGGRAEKGVDDIRREKDKKERGKRGGRQRTKTANPPDRHQTRPGGSCLKYLEKRLRTRAPRCVLISRWLRRRGGLVRRPIGMLLQWILGVV